jgi:hypothetical protein
MVFSHSARAIPDPSSQRMSGSLPNGPLIIAGSVNICSTWPLRM